MLLQPDKKICLITGASSGIGKSTVLGLAQLGMHVVLVCRNKDKGIKVQQEVIAKTRNSSIDLFICDLTRLSDVRNVAQLYNEKYTHLNI